MATNYLEAVTRKDHDGDKFDPKTQQKAIYMWYDSRYSDEALDIYSKEWQERIRDWHHAHQSIVTSTNTTLSSDELLETLDLGNFFLAHPIAGFSLWRVLQACYELDRAVCGDTDEVAQWQVMPPFKYLKDEGIQSRWKAEIGLLKQQMVSLSSRFGKQPAKFKMYEILVGVERYENAFESLKENFETNGKGKGFASWMIGRVEEGVRNRLAVTELLKIQDGEVDTVQLVESHEVTTATKMATNPAPAYIQTATLPTASLPPYSSPVTTDFPEPPQTRETAPVVQSVSKENTTRHTYDRMLSGIKTGAKRLARKARRQKNFIKSIGH
ncbi:hypothetical protein DL95DRAFT_519783 [Leptodontidium sp. 2 PMI_412]|nr:hypothetical protein DL95DRAFT_519783 [Leptodontidium sp. 2 PMI_412]